MFLVDDILLSPLRGFYWIVREVHKAAEEELANESEVIKADLSELHRMLEAGRITGQEFDAREKELLDRLDTISERAETCHV
ncbi:MAG: gas vesicle protein GvpG [Deltaproteobacteria bacterium]|nr:gas vesicle protein GvpG [Deltaproteobacteria bacterium]